MSRTTSNDDSSVDDVINRLSISKIEEENADGNEDNDVFPSSSSLDKNPDANKQPSTSKRSTSGSTGGKNSGDSLGPIKRLMSGGGNKEEKKKEKDKISIEHLPQKFIAKYLGSKPCPGLFGTKYTRPLVDELVTDLKGLSPGDDVPLLDVTITSDGIHTALHKKNQSKKPLSDLGLTPLEFISYAVQDTRYPRVATFVLVREMSSRSRTAECHAYLCDSVLTARRISLSLALAFKQCAKKLEGKPYRFEVDLSADGGVGEKGSRGGGVAKGDGKVTETECEA